MTQVRFLQLELDVTQETDQIIYTMQNQPERKGRYSGAYVLGPEYVVVPVLVVSGLKDSANIADKTHLIIVTTPKAQKKTQKCSPFANDYISTVFQNFVLPEHSKLDYNYKPPKGFFPPQEGTKIYIPEAADGYLQVPGIEVCTIHEELISWKLSGFLALHREGDDNSFDEQVLCFDPEVIIDTGC